MVYRQSAGRSAGWASRTVLDICCQHRPKPWGDGSRPNYLSFAFKSKKESHVYLQHISRLTSSETDKFFRKLLRTKQRVTDCAGVRKTLWLDYSNMEIPSEYLYGRKQITTIRDKLTEHKAALLSAPIDKRPTLPGTKKFSLVKKHVPILDKESKQQLMEGWKAANPELTQQQLDYYKEKFKFTPTRWSPRILDVGQEPEEARDKDEFVGNSGTTEKGTIRRMEEDNDAVAPMRAKRRSVRIKRATHGKPVIRLIACPVTKQFLYKFYVHQMKRRILVSLMSTAIEIYYGETETRRIGGFVVEHHNFATKSDMAKGVTGCWVAEMIPPGEGLASASLMGVSKKECTFLRYQPFIVGYTESDVALFRDKKNATRALLLQMIFSCHSEEQQKRRRVFFMRHVLRRYLSQKVTTHDKNGFFIWPVFDNGGKDDEPLFYYATKNDRAYLMLEAADAGMKMVSLNYSF